MQTRKSYPILNFSESASKFAEKLKKVKENNSRYYYTLFNFVCGWDPFSFNQSTNGITTNRFVRWCSRSKRTFTRWVGDRRPGPRRRGIKRDTEGGSSGTTGREGKTRRRRENRTFRRLPREKDEKPWKEEERGRKMRRRKGAENWKSQLPRREITRVPEKFTPWKSWRLFKIL